MKTFKVKKSYSTRSICDSNCIWNFEVIKRTAKTVTIFDKMDRVEKRCKIHIYDNCEMIYPLGHYSMAPSLRAENQIDEN